MPPLLPKASLALAAEMLARDPVYAVAEFNEGFDSRVLNTGKSLNLTTFTAGLRYSPLEGRFRLQPYWQVLLGPVRLDGRSWY